MLLQNWATILYKTAWYLLRMGNKLEAKKLSVKAMNVRIKILGRNYEDTLNAMVMVGSAYDFTGRWEAAEKLDVEVMETSKQKLGADHPFTLTSMNNFAFTWHGLGQHTEAISLMTCCLQVRTRILGVHHPYMSFSAEVLAQWEIEAGLDNINFSTGNSGSSRADCNKSL